MKKMVKVMVALLGAFVSIAGYSAEEVAEKAVEDITLMASETAPAITTTTTALKWTVTKDDTDAAGRLTINVERLVDSTAKVTITADGTEAAKDMAVLGLYGDGVLVKTINVTITEKVDKDYVAENTGAYENAVVSYKDARLVQIGKKWTYTTATTGTGWSIVPNSSSYKGYALSKMHDYFQEEIVQNPDGTATVTITGIAPAGTKSLILDIKNSQKTVMTVQVIVVEAVEDITMLKGSTERRTGSYNGSGTSRRWVADRNFNSASNQGTVGLSLKNGTREFQQADFQYASTYQDYKYQTTQWASSFNADLTANKIGRDVVRIARFEPNNTGSFSPCFLYNIYVYEEKTTNITMKSGETFDLVCESEVAGAWEVEGLAENDETVTLSDYAGWTDTSFETTITANKAGEKAFTVRDNFCVYTVNVTIEQGTEIKNVSVAAGDTYVDNKITDVASVQSDATGVATITRDSDTQVTIHGFAAGDAVCIVKDNSGTTNYLYNVTVYSTATKSALVERGKTADFDCVSDFAGEWTAEVTGEKGIVAIVNEWGASDTSFKLLLEGEANGETTVLVKNKYAQYTFNVRVANIQSIDVPKAASDLTYTGTEQTGVPTGTGYTITGNVGTNAGNYTATATLEEGYRWADDTEHATNIAWSIGRATATVTADNKTKVYGDDDPTTFTATVTGTNGFDGATITWTDISRTNKCEDVGTYDIVPSGDPWQDANYTVEFVAGALTITRKPIAKPTAAASLIYTGAEQIGIAAGTGYDIVNNVATNAGTYTATATLDGNHMWTGGSTDAADVNFTIAPAEIAVTADNKTVKLDASVPDYTYTVSPALFGNDKLEGSLACAYDPKSGTNEVGMVFDILQGTLTNANYTITSFTKGTLTIASLMVTLSPAGRTYDGTAFSTNDLTFAVTDNDGNPITDFSVAGTNSMLDAGTYTFKVTTANGLEGSADFVVSQALVTVTAVSTNKVYSGSKATDPEFMATVEGLVDGEGEDLIEYTLARAEGENVGDYDITPSGDASQGNYKVEFVPATFTIFPKDVTVTANSATKTYGEDDPKFTATVVGTNGTDGVTIQYKFMRDEGDVATNATPYVIRPVSTQTGYTGNIETQGNYVVTYDWSPETSGTLTISRKSVTVTIASTNLVYGDVYPDWESSVDNLPYGDKLDYTLAPLNCNGDASETAYEIAPIAYNTNGNYDVTFVNGELTIDRLPVFVTVIATNKVYGAKDPDFTYVVSNAERTAELKVLPNGTDVVLNGELERVAGEDVKDSPYDVDTLTFFNETNNPNYVFEAALDGENKFTILSAPLTVAADDKTKVYGEDDPALTATVKGLVNGDTEASLGLVYSLDRATGEGAGTYAITPTGTTPQGGEYGKNYDIAYSNGTFTITKATLKDDMAAEIPDQRWAHGDEVKPIVTLSDGTLMTAGDYEITGYSANIAPGTGKVIVEGRNNYTGTIEVPFTILTIEETAVLETFEHVAEISYDDQSGVLTLKLTNDVEGAVELFDNLGDVVIDLNSHCICGKNGAAETDTELATDGEPAIRIVSAKEAGSEERGNATALSVIDESGEPADPGLKGGNGGAGHEGPGGNGGAGIEVDSNALPGVEVAIDDGVRAEGGKGGDGNPNGKDGLVINDPKEDLAATIEVDDADDGIDEGDKIVIRVNGGSYEFSSSVQLQAVYGTASSSDLDLKNVKVNDAPVASFSFPYTITWGAGTFSEQVIEIPVKKQSSAKNDRDLIFELQNPQNLKLKGVDGKFGNMSYRKTKIKGSKGPVTDKFYVRATPNDATRGKTSGSSLVAAGKKATVKATANKGYVFMDWTTNGVFVSDAASYAFTVTTNVDFVAHFEPLAADYLELKDDFLPSELKLGEVFSNAVTVASGSLPTISVSGLPTGLKYYAKETLVKATSKTPAYTVPANTIYGIPTKASATNKTSGVVTPSKVKVTVKNLGGYKIVRTYELRVTAQTTALGTAKVVADDKPFATVSVALSDDAAGKVTGAGLYQAGKKVTLKATANKGYVFAEWLEDGVNVSSNASYVIASMPSNNVSLVAKFVLPDEIADPSGKAGTYGVAIVRNNDFAGNVTGAGYYAAGKKVTLKATANKGYVFSEWTTVDGVHRTQDASLVIDKMPAANLRYVAVFVTAGEDLGSIVTDANGMLLAVTEKGIACLATNVMCGVDLQWPVVSTALSLPKVAVSGLPSGLKFTAKPVTAKVNGVTVTNVPANTIYGAPTAASSIDKTTNLPKPSKVKVTVTTSGKSKAEYQIDLVVNPLPDYAVGTFDGPVFAEDGTTNGVVKLTVAKNGKISGTIQTNCVNAAAKKLSLSVASFADYDLETKVFTLAPTYKDGKETVEVPLTLSAAAVDGGTIGAIDGESLFAYQNVLKGAAATKFIAPELEAYTNLTLTVAKDGVLKIAGKVKDNSGNLISASGTSQIYYDADEAGFRAVIYLPSKKGFDGVVEVIEVNEPEE